MYRGLCEEFSLATFVKDTIVYHLIYHFVTQVAIFQVIWHTLTPSRCLSLLITHVNHLRVQVLII